MLSKSKKEIFSHCLQSSHFVKISVDPGNLVLLRFYVADHFLCKKKKFTSVALEVRFITALPCDCVWFMRN